MAETWLIFALMISLCVGSEDNCASYDVNNYESVFKKSKKIERLDEMLRKQDEKRATYFAAPLSGDETGQEIRTKFYRMTSQPLQSYCSHGKTLGSGTWLDACGFLDGQKFVCLDSLVESAAAGECLVYSFGVGKDASFENSMADLGCRVRAFDPTATSEEEAALELHQNVSFHKLGISHFNGNTQVFVDHRQNEAMLVPVRTLSEMKRKFGEEDKRISYLKVDVEGSEIKAMGEWIKSGVLDSVDQIGMEMHTGRVHIQPDRHVRVLKDLVGYFQTIYKMGFMPISYEANGCVGKSHDIEGRFYSYFDVVLYRAKT